MNKYINFLWGRDYFTDDKGKVKKSERTFEVSQFGKKHFFQNFIPISSMVYRE